MEPPQAKPPKKRRRWLIVAAVAFVGYVLSYLVLGERQSGETFETLRPVSTRYTYHDRHFAFDPWFFVPATWLECLVRGGDTQIVVRANRARFGGNPSYAFGPLRYMAVDPKMRRLSE